MYLYFYFYFRVLCQFNLWKGIFFLFKKKSMLVTGGFSSIRNGSETQKDELVTKASVYFLLVLDTSVLLLRK